MGERLGPYGDQIAKGLIFGSLTSREVNLVIDAYRRTRSYAATSSAPGIYMSPATVSRVVSAAEKYGILPPGIKRSAGRPRFDRTRIKHALNAHPDSTTQQLARTLGVSSSTIFLAKRGK